MPPRRVTKPHLVPAVLRGGMGARCAHHACSGWGWLVALGPGGRGGRAGQKPLPWARVTPPGPLNAHLVERWAGVGGEKGWLPCEN